MQPVFISVDPERDSAEKVREYVKGFHPRLIGLTGTTEKVGILLCPKNTMFEWQLHVSPQSLRSLESGPPCLCCRQSTDLPMMPDDCKSPCLCWYKSVVAMSVPSLCSLASCRVHREICQVHFRLQVREAARAYRVYYTKTNDDPEDYLVDHSIIMYLLDPQARFMAFYGKNLDRAELSDKISKAIV